MSPCAGIPVPQRDVERPPPSTPPLPRGHEQRAREPGDALPARHRLFVLRARAPPQPHAHLRDGRGLAPRHQRSRPARLRSLPLVRRPGLSLRRRRNGVGRRLRPLQRRRRRVGDPRRRRSAGALRHLLLVRARPSPLQGRADRRAHRAQVRRDADLPTPEGQRHPLLTAFGDRLFAFEHRNWEAVDLDEPLLRKLGGALLARESRDGVSRAAPSSRSRSRPASRPCSSTPKPIAPA